MGKKKGKKTERMSEADERALEAERQRDAEEAELRAEIAALGGLPPGLAEVDGEEGASTSSGSGASGSGASVNTANNGSTLSYNKAGLESKLEDIELELPFRQTLMVTSSLCLGEVLDKHDVHDDLKRETAFYQQAQQAVAAARKTLDAGAVPYLRPDDYYAEMVKSDGHMQRIRDSLLFEQKKMKAFDQRKRNTEQKKFGKRLQAEKAIAKAAEKRATLEAIKQIRKRRGQNNEGGGGGGGPTFDIQLETETEAAAVKQQRGGWVHDRMENAKGGGGRGRDKTSGKTFKRSAKDSKYGFGGGQRKGGKSKRNNESRDDAGNYGKRSNSSKNSQRPGKKRRMQKGGRR